METTKIFILTGVGAIIGGIGGYFASKWFLAKFMTDESIEEYVEEVFKNYPDLDDSDMPEQEPKDLGNDELKPEEKNNSQKEKIAPEDYTIYHKTKNKPDIASLVRELLPPTKLITLKDFMANELMYSVETLTYWTRDNVLATSSTDEKIPDIISTIGSEALSNFGYGNDDPDVVYVRNDQKQTDYEVTRVDAAYEELVEGLIAEEEPAPPKSNKKVKKNVQK